MNGRAAVIGLSLLLAGCGTLQDLGGGVYAKALFDGPAPHPLGGVRLDVYMGTSDDCHLPLGFFSLFDLPFSLAMDLALLPVSIPLALFSGGPSKGSEDPPARK